MNGWKKAMELRDELSSGLFVRLDERGISGVFCGEPYGRAVVWVGGRPVTYDKRIHRDSPKGMFAFNFYDMKRGEMRIIEGSQRLFDAVYEASQKSGLDKCVFEVKKFPPEGQGLPATFTVDAAGSIDAALSSSVNATELNDLATVVGGERPAPSAGGDRDQRAAPAATMLVNGGVPAASAPLVDHQTAVELHAGLKKLSPEERQGFLANFGIDRVSKLHAVDVDAARAYVAGPAAADDDEIPL